MAGDFTGIRKKTSSSTEAGAVSVSAIGGTNVSNRGNSHNEIGDYQGRRLFENNNGIGRGDRGGVLVPVHHYKDPLKTYKIVILGDGGVGKSGEHQSKHVSIDDVFGSETQSIGGDKAVLHLIINDSI